MIFKMIKQTESKVNLLSILQKGFLFLLIFGSSQMMAQQTLTGVVADDQGPLPGATILVEGTSNGVSSDFDGNFSIQANSGDVLEISYVGFKTQKIIVADNQDTVNVYLVADNELDEIVLTGYGTTKRANLTNAVSKLNTESLVDRPIMTLGEAFSGQIAGVYAQQSSGLPGAEFNIKIRGTNSITSGSNPLYIIDGMPVESMRDINIGDIESIDVLKDASAGGIYGARAAGGVVIIKTKQAKPGETKIDIDVYTGMESIAPGNKLNMLSGPEYIEHNEWSQTLRYINDNGGVYDGTTVEQRSNKYHARNWWYTNPEFITDTDWQKEITQTAARKNYQVSIFKGVEGGNFMISSNYNATDGLVINTKYERFSFRANGNYKINDYVSAGLSMSTTVSRERGRREAERKEGAYMRAIVADPTIPVDFNHRNHPLGLIDNPNPVLQMQNIKDYGKRKRSLVTSYITIQPLEGLDIKGQFGFDIEDSTYDYFKPMWLNKKARREALNQARNDNKFLYQLTATYDLTFGDHNIDFLAGTSYEKQDWEVTTMDSWDFGGDDITTFNAATALRSWNDYEMAASLQSYFGRAVYNFDDKYIVNLTVRQDGSSKFGKNNKWALFPAASVAWRLSNDIIDNPDINQLKIRASWGQAGNDRIGAYSSYGQLVSSNYSFGGNLGYGFSPSTASNPDIKWETTTTSGIGIDFGFFGNKIYGSLDYYKNITSDVLLEVELPAVSGLTQASTLNSGEVENWGWELELNTVNIKKTDFTWQSSLNFSNNENKVTKLGYGMEQLIGTLRNQPTHRTQIGRPLHSYYMYQTDGLYTESDISNPSADRPLLNNAVAGNTAIVDTNKDGVINSSDRTELGNNTPDYIIGFTNTFKYKNFDVRILATAVLDFKAYYFFGRYMDSGQTGRNQLSKWANGARRLPSTGGVPTGVPFTMGNGDAYNRAEGPNLPDFTDRWLYDGDYLRLKNITVGYTFDKETITRVGMKNLRLYLSADNVLNSTEYPGGNPEANNSEVENQLTQGVDYAGYPLSRTVTVGLKATF